MGLPNTLKPSPLPGTLSGTVQAGSEFGNSLAQMPGPQASPNFGQALTSAGTPFTPLPFSAEEARALAQKMLPGLPQMDNAFGIMQPSNGFDWLGGRNAY